MHDELLRDDPKLNLGRKHASGGMLFHSRVDRSNSQTKRFDVSIRLSQQVAQVPGNQLIEKHSDSASCSVLCLSDLALLEARYLRISRIEVIGREEDASSSAWETTCAFMVSNREVRVPRTDSILWPSAGPEPDRESKDQ